MTMAEEHWGPRTRWAYAWQSIRRTGASIVFGSDAPVEPPNPFLGLYAAIRAAVSTEHPQRVGFLRSGSIYRRPWRAIHGDLRMPRIWIGQQAGSLPARMPI